MEGNSDIESKAMKMELLSGTLVSLDHVDDDDRARMCAEGLCGTFSIDREPVLFCQLFEHIYCRRPRQRETLLIFLIEFLRRKSPDRRDGLVSVFTESKEREVVECIRKYFRDSPLAAMTGTESVSDSVEAPEILQSVSMNEKWVEQIRCNDGMRFRISLINQGLCVGQPYFFPEAVAEIRVATPFQLAVYFNANQVVDVLKSILGFNKEALCNFIKFSVIGGNIETLMSCSALTQASIVEDAELRNVMLTAVLEYDHPLLFSHYITNWAYGDEDTYKSVCRSIVQKDAILCLIALSEHPHFDMLLFEEYASLIGHAGSLTKTWLTCAVDWFQKGVSKLETILSSDTVYATKELAVQAVRDACRLCGFDVSLESGSNGNSLKFTCSYGGKGSAIKRRSKKCNCPWTLSMSNSKRIGGYHVTGKNLRHCLHGLNRDTSSFDGLSQQGRNILAAMRCSRVPPSVIQQVSKIVFNSTISIRDVDRLAAMRESGDKTPEMLQKCRAEGGLAWDYVSQGTRVAVLLIRSKQRKYLRYTDVIFVDATKIPNENDWLTVPVTILDSCLEIRCVATLFTAIATGEIYQWAMRTLFQVTEIKMTLRTIITDEDTALLSIMDVVKEVFLRTTGRELHDILCAWHKGKNFQKRWSVLSPDIRDRIANAWHRLAYSTKIVTATAARQEITDLLQGTELANYFRDSIVPYISKFSWAHITAFTLGYNTTGVAESSNAKYKRMLTTVRYTLWDISENILHVDSLADKEQERQKDLRHSKPSLHTDIIGLKCHGRLQNILEKSLNKALRLEVTTNHAHNYWQISDPVFAVTHTVIEGRCDCNKTVKVGLPCSHIIAVQRCRFLDDVDAEPFPYHLIAPRFNVTRTPYDPERVRQLFRTGKDPLIAPDLESANHQVQIIHEGLSETQRSYRYLHHIIDPIISQASQNKQDSQNLATLLQDVAQRAFKRVEDMKVGSRGKPRKKRLKPASEVSSAPR